MTDTDTAPAINDIVTINDERARVDWVGRGPYSIVVAFYGGPFEDFDRDELTLTTPAGRGRPAVWACWTDADGRRA